MSPKLTDEAVSLLPLGAGRAELLEEIMSTVAPDRPAPVDRPAPKRRGVLVPLAAAAVVGAVAVSSLWWHDGSGAGNPSNPGHRDKDSSHGAMAAPAAQHGFRAVLDAPGWHVSATEASDGFGEVDYEKGGASFTISWYRAESYAGYVEDREHIVDPPAPGEPVQVLGRAGQLWAYNATDHTVIREVESGHWMELRGTGMGEAAYRSLLGSTRLVGLDAYEAALPGDYISRDDQLTATDDVLGGITEASGAGWPDGRVPSLDSDQQDPYQFGAETAGAYACAWLDEFAAATSAGDSARAAEAARVLGTAHQWPVLNEMNAQGDYPEVLWQYADDVVAGDVPVDYQDGLGCR